MPLYHLIKIILQIYYNGAMYDEKETEIIEKKGGENEIF